MADLTRYFPRWMALASDPTSVGARLLSALAKQIGSLQDKGIANLVGDSRLYRDWHCQASWLIELQIVADVEAELWRGGTLVAEDSEGTTTEVRWIDHLHQLALEYPDNIVALADTNARRIYVRPPLDDDTENLKERYKAFRLTLADRSQELSWAAAETGGEGYQGYWTFRLFWNAFDEAALRLAAKRRDRERLESNKKLARRTIYHLRYPPDSTPGGLLNAACVEVELVAETSWPAGQPSLALTEPDVRPETVWICPVGENPELAWMRGAPAHPSQLRYDEANNCWQLTNELSLLTHQPSWERQGLRFGDDGSLQLADDQRQGTAIIPVLVVANAERWEKLVVRFSGAALAIDIAVPSSDPPDRWQWRNVLIESQDNGSQQREIGLDHLGLEELGINPPTSSGFPAIAVRVQMRRLTSRSPSPRLEQLNLHYTPGEAVATYLYGVTLHPLQGIREDPKLGPELFDVDGHPKRLMRQLLDELRRKTPILWGSVARRNDPYAMRWDEHYWDVVKPGLGLTSAPSQWDPQPPDDLEASIWGDPSVWQAGIGDLEDLRLTIDPDSFSPRVAGGYAFVLDGTSAVPQPAYRFVNRHQFTHNHSGGGEEAISLPEPLAPGYPIVVERAGQPFRMAAYFDEDEQKLKLQMRGFAISDGKALVLPHPRAADIHVEDASLRIVSYDGDRRLFVDPTPPFGVSVPVSYFLEDSFVWDGEQLRIYTSQAGELTITYEKASGKPDEVVENLDLSPLTRPEPFGFVYHTMQEPALARIEVRIYPDEYLAWGPDTADWEDWGWAEVRLLDTHGNPVLGYDDVTLVAEAAGLPDAGTFERMGAFGERHVFRYRAPRLTGSPPPEPVAVAVRVKINGADPPADVAVDEVQVTLRWR